MQYLEQINRYVIANKPNAREKLSMQGIGGLSNLELVMLLLGSGTKKIPVAKLANGVLEVINARKQSELCDSLQNIDGMGKSKSALVAAAIELGRRMNGVRGKIITQASDILPLIGHYALEFQEHFLCATLTGAHEMKKIRLVAVGTLTRSLIHPREIFSDAIVDRAAAVIICHNHPSGNCDPSPQDIEATARIKSASEILGICLLDHIVFAVDNYFSFYDHKLL